MPAELCQTVSKLEELAQDTLRRLERATKAQGSSNVSSITVQAGGVGVWLSATCCAVMLAALLVLAVVGAAAYTDMRADIRALRDTDNAIRAYIHTGILKPATDENRETEDVR
ncbi:hypothetical protein Psesu_1157 [Pseudoxanthomonas suwonensis 11-1]|uniref:Uncharacterized protein n=1 Tax=Pseudoxanthomonas suwonensis (strain 11-1) TaxID=743721 RepID=E6WS58_PSEUU|nr:hypothetical protein [Pseudoxanthomonas suwonensis]ADV27007.1 hypothetical protein Psesu_1157 [Pseudoxanthomonas suwonensis 11-1]